MLFCKLGFHKIDKDKEKIIFIRNEDNRSFWRIDCKCKRCGKVISRYTWLPLV